MTPFRVSQRDARPSALADSEEEDEEEDEEESESEESEAEADESEAEEEEEEADEDAEESAAGAGSVAGSGAGSRTTSRARSVEQRKSHLLVINMYERLCLIIKHVMLVLSLVHLVQNTLSQSEVMMKQHNMLSQLTVHGQRDRQNGTNGQESQRLHVVFGLLSCCFLELPVSGSSRALVLSLLLSMPSSLYIPPWSIYTVVIPLPIRYTLWSDYVIGQGIECQLVPLPLSWTLIT